MTSKGDEDSVDSPILDERPKEEFLPDGEALTPASVEVVTLAEEATVIVLAGSSESGKTTLITSIYERFLSGRVTGQLFAGSRTFIGLERRAHPARIRSKAPMASTQHTTLAEGQLLYH